MEQHRSDLLSSLEQLNDATWSQGAAPAAPNEDQVSGRVRLACKQLRQLCHGHQRRLRLTVANTSRLGSPLHLATFSRHFPAADDISWSAAGGLLAMRPARCRGKSAAGSGQAAQPVQPGD